MYFWDTLYSLWWYLIVLHPMCQLRLMPLPFIWIHSCIVCCGNWPGKLVDCVLNVMWLTVFLNVCLIRFIYLSRIFAVFHREILINPQISAIYWWISLINIVKSLDFWVKSLVFVLQLTVLALFSISCQPNVLCRIGVERVEIVSSV